MDEDEKIKDIEYLKYLLERTPVETRFQLLKSNFSLWESTFPKEASFLAEGQVIPRTNAETAIHRLQTMSIHPVSD